MVKLFYIIILFNLFRLYLFAQPQVNLTIDDNWLNIKVLGLETHCFANYKIDISIQNNNLLVFLKDTSVQKCKSNCNIDLEININQIPQGNYNIQIFSEELAQYGYNKDSRKLIYKKDIKIIDNFARSPLSYDYKQSNCTNTNEIVSGLEVYPNPISSKLTIRFELKSRSDINFKILNFLGKEVLTIERKNLSAGINTITLDADNLQPGMYVAKLNSTNGQSFSVKLLWSK